MLEAEAQGITSFQQLNDRFIAWAEQVCKTRVHAETGQTPIQRFTSQGPLHAVEPSLLREAFRWSVMRRVTSTASVSLAGNRYTVDQALVGRRVELRFDPEDLTKLDVYWAQSQHYIRVMKCNWVEAGADRGMWAAAWPLPGWDYLRPKSRLLALSAHRARDAPPENEVAIPPSSRGWRACIGI